MGGREGAGEDVEQPLVLDILLVLMVVNRRLVCATWLQRLTSPLCLAIVVNWDLGSYTW